MNFSFVIHRKRVLEICYRIGVFTEKAVACCHRNLFHSCDDAVRKGYGEEDALEAEIQAKYPKLSEVVPAGQNPRTCNGREGTVVKAYRHISLVQTSDMQWVSGTLFVSCGPPPSWTTHTCLVLPFLFFMCSTGMRTTGALLTPLVKEAVRHNGGVGLTQLALRFDVRLDSLLSFA
jgi:hypothetical protein